MRLMHIGLVGRLGWIWTAVDNGADATNKPGSQLYESRYVLNTLQVYSCDSRPKGENSCSFRIYIGEERGAQTPSFNLSQLVSIMTFVKLLHLSGFAMSHEAIHAFDALEFQWGIHVHTIRLARMQALITRRARNR